MTGQRFSNLDTLLLRMDNPAGPVVVTAMLVLGAPVDIAQLKATILTRLLHFDRFRQRVAPSLLPWRTPYWQNDPGFDLDYHVQRVALPPPGDQAVLRRTVSALAGAPLDMARPPWQMHLIEAYGPGSALVFRTHHSLADGVALVHVLLSLAGIDAVDPPSDPEQETPPRGSTVMGHSQGRTRRRLVGRLASRGLRTLGELRRLPELARLAWDAAIVVGDIVLSPPDADTLFRGTPSMPKSIAWSGPLSLEEIKTIGQHLGGTVNDVLLAALAGALLRYLETRQNLPDDASLRAIIPVNRRPPGAEAKLGNRISVVFLPLPLDTCRPDRAPRRAQAEDGWTQSFAAARVDSRGPGGRQPGSIAGVHVGARLYEHQGDSYRDEREGPRGTALPGWRPSRGPHGLDTAVWWHRSRDQHPELCRPGAVRRHLGRKAGA